MKILPTTIIGTAGLVYGLAAVVLVYHDVPVSLQAFIVVGVAASGAGLGWLIGMGASFFRHKEQKKGRPELILPSEH